MTIAIDIRTGRPCGQVVNVPNPPNVLTLLTAKGYMDVCASSVRLEELR